MAQAENPRLQPEAKEDLLREAVCRLAFQSVLEPGFIVGKHFFDPKYHSDAPKVIAEWTGIDLSQDPEAMQFVQSEAAELRTFLR